MRVLQTVRSWAEQHNIDYQSEITKDHEWIILNFKDRSTYTLFAITYNHSEFEWHLCT